MYINKNPDQEHDLSTPLHNASAAWLAQRLQNVYAVCNQSDALEWQQQAERSCRLDGAGVSRRKSKWHLDCGLQIWVSKTNID